MVGWMRRGAAGTARAAGQGPPGCSPIQASAAQCDSAVALSTIKMGGRQPLGAQFHSLENDPCVR